MTHPHIDAALQILADLGLPRRKTRNPLKRKPQLRFDWSERTLIDVTRWANQRRWRYDAVRELAAAQRQSRKTLQIFTEYTIAFAEFIDSLSKAQP